MLVGYMRVSTAEQNLARQRDALESMGCERLYEDVCSGAVTDRPGLTKALDQLRAGDALVVWKLDRIGRSLGHVVELVGGLQAKGIGLKVLTGGIDTTSSTGRLVFGIFATLAEFERDLIRERTLAGLAAARARGRAARHLYQHVVRLRRRRGTGEAARPQAARPLINRCQFPF